MESAIRFPEPHARHSPVPSPPTPDDEPEEVDDKDEPEEARVGLFDLVLRGQKHLSAVLRDEGALPVVTQRLLALSLLGLGVHGLVVGFAAQMLDPRLAGGGPLGPPVLWMSLAFVVAFVGALGVCLPSFYFYTQLSGLDASFRLVTAQALRAQATTAVLLLGIIPFYAAAVLACSERFGMAHHAPRVILVGMALPFVVGLAGMRALYRGFCDLAEVLPRTHHRRGHFLRRMVLCWAVIYTAVAPVALYRLVEHLGPRLVHIV